MGMQMRGRGRPPASKQRFEHERLFAVSSCFALHEIKTVPIKVTTNSILLFLHSANIATHRRNWSCATRVRVAKRSRESAAQAKSLSIAWGIPDGLTLWEVTIAELLSERGYATGIWGKWHLGSAEARFPTHRGFDEWYGIPRTYDEAMWPSLNETNSVWPSVGNQQGWNANVHPPEYIYEARKGEKARQVAELNIDRRRTMEAEITNHAVDFIKRNANTNKPFFAYVSFSLFHFPTLPNPEFAGKTGNGDWADCLAEMDYRVGQILDAIKEGGVEDNTIVIFASDNGPEATHPWEGDGGPSRTFHPRSTPCLVARLPAETGSQQGQSG